MLHHIIILDSFQIDIQKLIRLLFADHGPRKKTKNTSFWAWGRNSLWDVWWPLRGPLQPSGEDFWPVKKNPGPWWRKLQSINSPWWSHYFKQPIKQKYHKIESYTNQTFMIFNLILSNKSSSLSAICINKSVIFPGTKRTICSRPSVTTSFLRRWTFSFKPAVQINPSKLKIRWFEQNNLLDIFFTKKKSHRRKARSTRPIAANWPTSLHGDRPIFCTTSSLKVPRNKELGSRQSCHLMKDRL